MATINPRRLDLTDQATPPTTSRQPLLTRTPATTLLELTSARNRLRTETSTLSPKALGDRPLSPPQETTLPQEGRLLPTVVPAQCKAENPVPGPLARQSTMPRRQTAVTTRASPPQRPLATAYHPTRKLTHGVQPRNQSQKLTARSSISCSRACLEPPSRVYAGRGFCIT